MLEGKGSVRDFSSSLDTRAAPRPRAVEHHAPPPPVPPPRQQAAELVPTVLRGPAGEAPTLVRGPVGEAPTLVRGPAGEAPTLVRGPVGEAPRLVRALASQAPTVQQTLASEAVTLQRSPSGEAATLVRQLPSEPVTVPRAHAPAAHAPAPQGAAGFSAEATRPSYAPVLPAIPRASIEEELTGDHPDHIAYAATALSPADNFATLPSAPVAPSLRSTVLPRVEIIGSEATLIVDGKRRYENVRPLGRGGIGEVVGAQDNDIGRPVALKRLRADMQTPSVLVRFVEEIRTTGRLEHPNIVPIHDVGLDEDGHYYFVMKYVDGETLEAIIAKLVAGDPEYHRTYTFERRVQIFEGILDAIGFAHDHGIVHRDIKPANVMVGAHGEVMVMDWGIAKSLRDPSPENRQDGLGPLAMAGAPESGRAFETQVGTLLGTPAYMSPEQASARPVDERSDIYSLSVLFYELLTLQHPVGHKGSLAETLAAVIQDPVKYAPLVKNPHQRRVPVEFGRFLERGLRKQPSERYGSIAEMRYWLMSRAEGRIPVQCTATLLKRMSMELGRLVDQHPLLMHMLVYGGGLAALGLLIYRALA